MEIADGQALTMYSSIVGACYYSGAVAAVPAIVGGKKMRLDKFLKVSRLIKRRTVANEACDAGRVMVNGKAAKASVQVKPGDVIEIQFGTRTVKAEVLQLQDTDQKGRGERALPLSLICRHKCEQPFIYIEKHREGGFAYGGTADSQGAQAGRK